MTAAVSFGVLLAVAVVIALVAQFVIRPRLGTRGRLALDAAGGDRPAEIELRRQLSHDVLSRLTPGIYVPGGPLMKGKAAKHLALLHRTFIVRAAPEAVVTAVQPVVVADGRWNVAGYTDPAEAMAWVSPGLFGPYPRISVRASTVLPGAAEFGVTHFQWSLKFPQGGPVVAKLWDPTLAALSAAHLPWTEVVREFEPGPDVRTDLDGRDGVWHATGLAVQLGADLRKVG